MNKLRFILFIFITQAVYAQNDTLYYQYNAETTVVNHLGDTLLNAWVGGLNQPQINMMDLNGDGKKDLVLFDRAGSKTLTYIAYLDKNKAIKYAYDPQYERLFPKSEDVLILADYERDGLMDCYYRDPFDGYIKYAKNNGNGFDEPNSFLKTYNFSNPPFDSSNFVLWTGNFPAVVDIDFDGDIDFLSTDYCGTSIVYNLCNQQENGLNKQVVSYETPDRCFGALGEDVNGLKLGAKCDFNKYYRYKKKHCASKTLAFYDIDGDGDKDLFLGNSEDVNNPLVVLINGKKEYSLQRDTFIFIDTTYFSVQEKSLMPVAPASFFLDYDQDGLTDLIVCANETRKSDYEVHETNQIQFYKNTGSNAIPKFVYQTNNLLVGDMIDYGALAQPVLYDTDNDGDLDLIIISNGDFSKTGDQHDRLIHYENIGTKTKAFFKHTSSDLWNISKDSIVGMHITFGDLNGDGVDELLIGTTSGEMSLYENASSKAAPNFRRISKAAFSLYISTNTTPQLVDVNRDGKIDLLVGVREGTIYYYENIGSKSAAVFKLVTDSFGKVLINEVIIPDPIRYNSVGYASVQLTDLDKDGKYDLLVGGLEGYFRVYRNVEANISGAFKLTDSLIYHNNAFFNVDLGSRVKPFAGDLNGDGIPEVLVGTSRGGVQFFKGHLTANGPVSLSPALQIHPISIFPNPTNSEFTIRGISRHADRIEIFAPNGQLVYNQSLNANNEVTLQPNLVSGIYTVKISGNKSISTAKLVILQK